MQGCKIPLARSHWRVNIDGGRVKLAMRSPDRASVFSSSEFVLDLECGNLTLVCDIPSHYALSFGEVSLNLLE